MWNESLFHLQAELGLESFIFFFNSCGYFLVPLRVCLQGSIKQVAGSSTGRGVQLKCLSVLQPIMEFIFLMMGHSGLFCIVLTFLHLVHKSFTKRSLRWYNSNWRSLVSVAISLLTMPHPFRIFIIEPSSSTSNQMGASCQHDSQANGTSGPDPIKM